MHSTKKNVQIIAQLLKNTSIEHIVLSPGSRNSPITLQFTQDDAFSCYSVIDERSAGFYALGMAQQLQKPVVLCCTSGSAAANYYPAVTEAFFQNIPLLILTADRPENLIDKFDGQTIRQNHLYENHSVGNFQLSEEETDPVLAQNTQIIQQALQLCFHKKAPVHINIPFSEPLYESTKNSTIKVDKFSIAARKYDSLTLSNFKEKWNNSSRKLILCGLLSPSEKADKILYQFAEDESVVILSETTSNLSHPNIFSTIDALIFSMNKEDFEPFAPEILLTIGQNVVSKKIKQLLRTAALSEHWHLDENWQPNTYFKLTEEIIQPKKEFLERLYSPNENTDFFNLWKELQSEKIKLQTKFLQQTPFSDLKVFEFLQHNLPAHSHVHFGNSSAIRYSQLFAFNFTHKVFCNRGTSGIEGSTSTAIGACIATQKPTFLISGDISFFYDSNALWNENIPNNFKIIILNNGGGEIFNFIPGPANIPTKNTYLVTQHARKAKYLCLDYNFRYFYADSSENLEAEFLNFLESETKSCIEINTANVENSQILTHFLRL